MNPFDNFEERIKQKNINLHGYCVVKDGLVKAEKYFYPFTKDMPHRMFSIAKSFTSLAIGKLYEEEKIGLDDHICDYFPEYVSEETHPWIRETTIRQMLMMASPHSKTTYKQHEDDNWTRTFFTVKPDHRPGTFFSYDTSAAHVLCALVEKLTGKDMLDYLRETVLDEIGFSREGYMMKDPSGVSKGGSGLMCTLKDITLVAELLRNKGNFNGKQLISEDYLNEATSNAIATNPFFSPDERNGYGYYFWRNRHDGYAMYGMGGQLALIFPGAGLTFTCIADTQKVTGSLQQLYDAFYECIYDYYETRKWSPKRFEREKLTYCYGTVPGKQESLYTDSLQGKTVVFEENPMDIKKAVFDFNDHSVLFYKGAHDFRIPFGFNEFCGFTFPESSERAVSSGAFISKNQFFIKIQIIDEDLSPVYVEFGFRPDGACSLRMENTPEPVILKTFAGCAGGEVIQ